MHTTTESISLAVIGGTGFYNVQEMEEVESYVIETSYGVPSSPIHVGLCNGVRIAFLARHGQKHSITPCRINYRANIAALHTLGVTRILAINAVGGITEPFAPQTLACPDQIIDYTWGRESSFCVSPNTPVEHIDFSQPFSAQLRSKLLAAAQSCGLTVQPHGCIGVTQGPRLETCAEIARLRRDGCTLVGMTSMPEAALAREKKMLYASLAIVANWAAGCGGIEEISEDDIHAQLQEATRGLYPLLVELARS